MNAFSPQNMLGGEEHAKTDLGKGIKQVVLGKLVRALVSGGDAQSSQPRTAEGERIYVIGDIHGRLDLLTELLEKIEEHASRLPEVRTQHVILLGDLIDRGRESAQVIDYVHHVQSQTDELVVLMGNHEELMLRALNGEQGVFRAWMRIGGDATLRSFGLEPPPRGGDYDLYARRFAATVPPAWVAWMSRLPLSARSGDYFFCHAGVRPRVPLKRQKKADLLWIRDEFLDDREDHGAVIVHGHSIADEVEHFGNRIGIDTGAYRTGVLTAMYLEGDRQAILATGVRANRADRDILTLTDSIP